MSKKRTYFLVALAGLVLGVALMVLLDAGVRKTSTNDYCS